MSTVMKTISNEALMSITVVKSHKILLGDHQTASGVSMPKFINTIILRVI